MGKIAALRALARHARDFERIVRERECRAVWNRGLRAVLATSPAARRLGVPCIWDIGVEENRGRLARWLRLRALERVDVVVTESPLQPAEIFGARAVKRHARKLRPNLPGIDRDAANALEAEWARRPAEPEPVIIAVGTLTPRKNQAMLVRALAEIALRQPDLRVELVGTSVPESYEAHLRELARTLGIEDRVAFLGWRDDVPRLIARSAALAVTSFNEGIPYVAREAIFLGVPVIATAVGGLTAIVRNGENGVLIAPNDTRALARAIEDVVCAPAERARLSAGARASRGELSHEKWARRYNTLFAELLEPPERSVLHGQPEDLAHA